MKRLTILCAALTAAMFMNMSAYAGTSEVAAEVSADTVCLPGADLTDVMGSGFIFSDQHPEITDPEYYLKEWYNSPGGFIPHGILFLDRTGKFKPRRYCKHQKWEKNRYAKFFH